MGICYTKLRSHEGSDIDDHPHSDEIGCRPKMREKDSFFLQNGAQLLRELITSCDGKMNPIQIFSAKELKKATDNYAGNRIFFKDNFYFGYTVCKGTHEDRTILVKRPAARFSTDPIVVKQFINEVVILSQINHKNVVKLLGCCLESQGPILVYEFFSFRDLLSDHIHESSQLSWKDRLRVATEIAEVLAYLHLALPKSIVHRDIQPRNILLDEHNHSRITNFGLAISIPNGETHVGVDHIAGTLSYMDPEFRFSGQLTEKSDVYSFGVVLVELLTGNKAQSIESMYTPLMEPFISYVKEKCLSIKGVKNKKTACADLAVRCLQKKSIERPTMKEVCQELRRIRSGVIPT